MHSILEVGSEQLRLFHYTAQKRQIQIKYALLVAHRVNSNIVRTVTNRQKEKICLKIILTSILFVIYFESQSI